MFKQYFDIKTKAGRATTFAVATLTAAAIALGTSVLKKKDDTAELVPTSDIPEVVVTEGATSDKIEGALEVAPAPATKEPDPSPPKVASPCPEGMETVHGLKGQAEGCYLRL